MCNTIYCYVPKSCKDINNDRFHYDLPFNFTLFDQTNQSIKVSIPIHHLFNVSYDDNPNTCHLSVFGSKYLNQWILGSVFFRNYYMVFDFTPKEMYSGLNYISIGISPMNRVYAVKLKTSKSTDREILILSSIVFSASLVLYIFVQLCRVCLLKRKKTKLIFIVTHIEEYESEVYTGIN